MVSVSLSKSGWCDRKYAVVEPIMPPPAVVSLEVLIQVLRFAKVYR